MEFNNMVKEKPTVRPTAQEGKLVKFVFSAIRANSISVAGTFNNWTPGVLTLKKDMVGVWRGSLYLKPGSYQYRFHVDGRWVNDPSARNIVPNEVGTNNTVLEVK
jgi:1,4-alpha-glucan branching enzyme